jgi:hypothetical protein
VGVLAQMRMGQRPLLAFLVILALVSPSRAFEVADGECRRILSGDARVRIHYSSGLKAEVDPVDRDNITSQVDVFADGRRLAHKWIGGLLPLDAPAGKFIYADKDATRFYFEEGETRQLSFTFASAKGVTTSGTLEIAVKRVEKAALGECQATFATIAITTSWANNASPPAKISRLFVKELGFFIASTVERMKDGKPEVVEFRTTRLELIR